MCSPPGQPICSSEETRSTVRLARGCFSQGRESQQSRALGGDGLVAPGRNPTCQIPRYSPCPLLGDTSLVQPVGPPYVSPAVSRNTWEASPILTPTFILSLLFQIPSLFFSVFVFSASSPQPLLWHSSFSLFSPPSSFCLPNVGRLACTPMHTHQHTRIPVPASAGAPGALERL